MVRARRTRRAAAEDLYKTCKLNNTCPPDVINKVEGTTIADKILQWGAAGTYFGGLSIGTGSGRGGATGYTPLGGRGGGVNIGSGGRVVRPPIPVDALGPAEVLPVDAQDPVIIPLTDGTPTNVRVVEAEIELTQRPQLPTPEVPAVSTEANVDGFTTAVLHVPPEATPPSRSSVTWSQYTNPAFEIAPDSSHDYGETSSSHNIFITGENSGVSVGENIPLTEFRTSTPRGRTEAVRRRGGYPRRLYERVRVSDPRFYDRPGSLVQFGFDNPLFDETLEFEAPSEPAAAPDPDFTDIVRLSRAHFSETGGRITVSRYGSRAGITTRSGVRIGSQVHFMHDISDITPHESIEMSVLGETSEGGPVTISDSDPITVSDPADLAFDEDAFESITLDSLTSADLDASADAYRHLLDSDDDPLIHGQLSFGRGRNRQSISVVVRPPATGGPVDTSDGGVFIDYQDMFPARPTRPPRPDVVIYYYGGVDYSLHPSLRRKRRRRRRKRVSF
ncbi:unnamed protein product [Canis familiaris papillomavirus 10]|uniref:Minor capsid protein L2 n=1 Tax=Canis familiaris papillomavirus 10 TaxID=1087109 RepID=G4XF74_9PAPI|nr:unnamed protein product [Canis familiaris papillomavirus 10]AEP82746.1 L2 [Canis familiaris papillomavirus 10]